MVPSLLAFRPVAAVHRLPARSEACPLSLKDVLRALEGSSATLPIVAAPVAAVVRASLLAAKDAGAVIGLALPREAAPEPWFDAVARAADELAPGLPFFVSAEVEVADGEAGLEHAFAVAHRLVESGIGLLAVDVAGVALARRAQAASQVAGFAADREIGIECVLPGADPPESEEASGFLEEFEGWGVRADLLSVRAAAVEGEAEAAAQLAHLGALSRDTGRPLLRRGPLTVALLAGAGAARLFACHDAGRALSAGLRAIPACRRAPLAGAGEDRDRAELSQELAERLEALVHAEVATLVERLGASGTATALARALGAS